ncbi:MAG TPA: YdeI/OmpD-associated family protein [Acidimicrobiia bacterium]|nr:YdeI/OmpD-associated family protein [Acidimicrobiia bacterium]
MSRFSGTIEEAPRGGAYVRIPPDVIEALGGGGRIPVQATFDGIKYRGSVVRMGGDSVLGVLKEIREKLGKTHGDDVQVIIERDEAEREVEIPIELASLLEANHAARKAFDALSYSHRREHALHVAQPRNRRPGSGEPARPSST